MNLHEYQGKELLKRFNVPVPEGYVIEDATKAIDVAKKIQKNTDTTKWAVKAQIHAGGRGKGGGVKIAANIDEVKLYADSIMGMNLVTPQTDSKGKEVRKILIEQNIYYEGHEKIEEFYMSIMMDRQKRQNVIIYSRQGGMDIEKVAEETPDLIFKEYINPSIDI